MLKFLFLVLLLFKAFISMAQFDNIRADLQSVLDKTVDGKKVFGTSFAIKQDNSTWMGVSGNFTSDQPYFIASQPNYLLLLLFYI